MKTIIRIIGSVLLWLPAQFAIGQVEKIEPRINISYVRSSDDVPYLKVLIRKRVERRYFPMEGIPFRAYFNEVTSENSMGLGMTNEKGEGIIEMPVSLMEGWHQSNLFEFTVALEETDSTVESSESISVQKARIALTTSDDRIIHAVVEKEDSLGWVPVAEVDVKFFIHRHFGKLAVTEDLLTTDDAGAVEVEYSDSIPGDEQGRITIGAMVEDHDEFGTVLAYTMTRWGTLTVDDNHAFNERRLWSTRDKTPLWLLIFPNLIIIGVWGTIGYLIFLIVRMRRI